MYGYEPWSLTLRKELKLMMFDSGVNCITISFMICILMK